MSVKSIFENMENTHVREDMTEAELWLQKTDLNLLWTVDDYIQARHSSPKKFNFFSSLKTKMQLLNKFADEVKKHSALLCQLELKERHILVKDSKNKAIPMFIAYLKYYAQWSCIAYDEYPDYEPCDSALINLHPNTSLPVIGAILGAALAAGCDLICNIDSKLLPLAKLLSELFTNAGFPKDTLVFVITNTFWRYWIYSLEISLPYNKTSAIIFENADLDSACDKLVDCAWSCAGVFPFGISQIFVQESAFEEFVEKIKSKILKLNVAYRENCNQYKTSDILISNHGNYEEEIEIVNKIPLQIGYKTFGRNKPSEDETLSDILSILAFRTATEAVNLVNNNTFGMGVSIWSDNISLCNEITGKIKAGIVWINTHGILSPNAAFSPFNGSIPQYFGGKEGISMFMRSKNINKKSFKNEYYRPYDSSDDVKTCLELAKKASETWCKYSPAVRSECLLKFAELSSSLQPKFPRYDFNEFWMKPLQYWSVISNNTKCVTQLQGNIELKVFKEPVGIILIHKIYSVKDFEVIIIALAYGNAVVINRGGSPEVENFLEDLTKIIPKTGIPDGLFNIIRTTNQQFINFTSQAIYFLNDYEYILTREMKLNAVTYNKCILTAFGETL